ncbi:MAG: 1-acyl-sn-glycerol-3-phosphate acyltransferase [Myxococcota bacterium]
MSANVQELIERESFRARLEQLSDELAEPIDVIRRRATEAFEAMVTAHQPLATVARRGLFSLVTDRVNVKVDRHALARLREVDADHPIAWLPAHRSYLDMLYLENAVVGAGISPAFILGGDNNDYWPLGAILRRTGTIFIRRTIKDDQVYRAALRSYLGYVVEKGHNLCWSIEGGRTRTGKLRPPRFGALRYVADAVCATDGPDMVVVPVSVVYDQLAEVGAMTSEALGARKEAEGLTWAARFLKKQVSQDTTVHLDFGEPIHMRARLEELAADPRSRDKRIERFAVQVCHHINQATPANATAIVTFALLSEDRALTFDEIQEAMAPLLRYLDHHPSVRNPLRGQVEVTGWLHRTLSELVGSGLLCRFDGEEPVWHIAPDQHLVAAFYRNTVIHLLVNRSITEVAFERSRHSDAEDLGDSIWEDCMRLRDLLKFEFFFSSRKAFLDDLFAEAALLDPEWRRPRDELPILNHETVEGWLERAHPHVAPTVLRPFLDAYSVVADQLVKWPDARHVNREVLLERCLAYGQQRVLQGKLESPESVTLELFKTGLQLAEHRGLLKGVGADVRAQRRAFAAEITDTVTHLRALRGHSAP